MKKIYTLLLVAFSQFGFSQAGAPASPYYDGFDWTKTEMALKNNLSTKITTTHTKILDYGQAENALKIVDLDPSDATNTNLFLIYGFSNNICPSSTADDNDHRRRNKNSDGGGSTCEWNREHVYPKSLGTPNLGEVGAGADAHHLRACDVQRNSNRSSSRFGEGSGNSGYFSGLWYPGDEWKGDVARNIMYLYLRYPTQCLPSGVGSGAATANDTAMLQLFLEWNAEDPVSEYEDKRNTYLGNSSNTYGQGNRNPFIDNPYLATVIWGGPAAENRWPSIFLSTDSFDFASSISVYPNPSNDNSININSKFIVENIDIISLNGQIIQQIKNPIFQDNQYTIKNLTKGFYFVKFSNNTANTTKKIIIN